VYQILVFTVFGYARNDFLATILIAIITACYYKISFIIAFFIWFLLGEILHYVFGTQTAFLTSIGVNTGC